MAQLGKYYQEIYQKLQGSLNFNEPIFWQGFFVGLAEKVFIGACRACMNAVDKEKRNWAEDIALDICSVYNLYTITIELKHRVEIWIAKDERDLIELQSHIFDNKFRAELCGYPYDEIDMNHIIDRPLK